MNFPSLVIVLFLLSLYVHFFIVIRNIILIYYYPFITARCKISRLSGRTSTSMIFEVMYASNIYDFRGYDTEVSSN